MIRKGVNPFLVMWGGIHSIVIIQGRVMKRYLLIGEGIILPLMARRV